MNFGYNLELIHKIVNETKKSVIGLILLSSMAIWIYLDYVPIQHLLFWTFLQIIFIVLRHNNAKQFEKYLAQNNRKKIKYHTVEFFIIIIYSAIVWDIGVIYTSYNLPNPYEFIGFAIVIGLITAGALSLLPIFNAYIIYFFMLIIPQIIIMFEYNTEVSNEHLNWSAKK